MESAQNRSRHNAMRRRSWAACITSFRSRRWRREAGERSFGQSVPTTPAEAEAANQLSVFNLKPDSRDATALVTVPTQECGELRRQPCALFRL
jgi:hypothetical protein